MVMSQISVTQLDSLLNFSRLHMLIFTPKWKLAGLHPNHRSFLGWDENDFEAFRFNYNFLDPNNLDISTFLGHFQNKTYVTRNTRMFDGASHDQGALKGGYEPRPSWFCPVRPRL